MEYKENALCYEDYCMLRESVGWGKVSEVQVRQGLLSHLYAVTAVENGQTVAMGRLIGDGIYYLIVDVVVHPTYQAQGIGKTLISMLVDYANAATPTGGRASIQLIAAAGKEPFYEKMGFKRIPHEFSGSGMRKVICK